MRVSLFFSLLAAATTAFSQYDHRKAYQLEAGTWIENFAPRGSSWYTRLTRIDRPEVLEVDPAHQHGGPRTIYTFPDATNATGITELSTDRYAVLTLNQVDDATTVSIWMLDTSGAQPSANKVIENIGGSELLNGLAAVTSDIVFTTDTLVGGVYRIDLQTGTADKVLSGDSFGPGVNGLRYDEPYLYYTNTNEGVFGRVEVDPITGAPAGEAEVLVSGEILVGVDDFALAYWTEAAFVANFYKNTLVRVNINEGTAEVVVEGIPAPTSATFATSGGLYVSTSGTGGDEGASIWSVTVPDETFVS
ncbi:hypothetical protein BDW59DRAFT_178403 [Aspergillus cavernicola]|uniref:SMP-30/Gluconolactonase/LRE-like region domain-containing protein n=1 Tax=Aspergillus cavernicola TaxID=176166 RepID=A0ABR4INT7_9EURO